KFEDQFRVGHHLLDHLPGDSAQWHLEFALPLADFLTGKSSDVDVDEPTRRWPLRQWAEKVRQAVVAIVFHRHRAIKPEVIALRSLLLDRLIAAALAVSQAEVYASGRGIQYDAEPEFDIHRRLSL